MSITPIGHYIGGQIAAGASGRSQPVTNPATGAVTGNVALANSAEVAKAVATLPVTAPVAGLVTGWLRPDAPAATWPPM
ncbi:MAG: hypothetical protein ACKOXU_12140 [Limnohabitans sp.]